MSIRTTKMQKIRRRVRDSIRVAKRRGYRIERDVTLNQATGCCCPLAAVYVANNRLTPGVFLQGNVDALDEVRRLFRLKNKDVENFVEGFDLGRDLTDEEAQESQYKAFGVELSRELDEGLL